MSAHKEMTRYAFISHMEDYIKKLLTDPLHADTDDFLKYHKIDGPKALSILTKRVDPNDENSAVIIKHTKIKDNGCDENGKRKPDTFIVNYKAPRKDYTKKMRNLYIRLFENTDSNDSFLTEMSANDLPELSKVITKKEKKNEITYYFGKNGWGLTDELAKISKKIEKLSKTNNVYIKDSGIDTLDDCYSITVELHPITEGSWGYGILDNDKALDNQTDFGKSSLIPLMAKLKSSNDGDEKWANLGVLIDFLKKYDDEEVKFTDEYSSAIELAKDTINNLLKDTSFIRDWDNPNKIKTELKHLYDKVITIAYDKDRLTEEGEGGGATSADASGQFTTPAFGKPIKRNIYITTEQEEYLKKIIKEESVMNTPIGDFGYDAPIGDGKKNKKNDFFADANNHKNIMKNSWPDENK